MCFLLCLNALPINCKVFSHLQSVSVFPLILLSITSISLHVFFSKFCILVLVSLPKCELHVFYWIEKNFNFLKILLFKTLFLCCLLLSALCLLVSKVCTYTCIHTVKKKKSLFTCSYIWTSAQIQPYLLNLRCSFIH